VPEGVLDELGHLGLAGSLGLHHRVDEPAVEVGRAAGALGSQTADDLGRVAHAVLHVAGVAALGREGDEHVTPHLDAVTRGANTSSVVPG
jgi:hypothetical protein